MKLPPGILITGTAGFVGARLAAFLATKDFRLLAASRATVDLTDREGLIRTIGKEQIDWVVHCASLQPKAGATAEDYRRGNVETLHSILDAMKAKGIRRIVHFSSAVVLGQNGGERLDETSPVDPKGDYALSKWESEKLLRERAEMDQLQAICFRMPSVFGAGQPGGIVPTYYELAKKNAPIELFSEGKLIRNLLHVDDLLRACFLTIQKGDRKPSFELFLLGSRNSLPTTEIAWHIVRQTGSRSTVTPVTNRAPVDIHWNLSVEKVSRALSFRLLSLEEGIGRYIAAMEGRPAHERH